MTEQIQVHAPQIGISASAPAVDQEALDILNKRFDGKLHGRMNIAKTEEEWNNVFRVLKNAEKNRNLRPNVRERFFRDCPHKGMVAHLRLQTGCLVVKYGETPPSPLKLGSNGKGKGGKKK